MARLILPIVISLFACLAPAIQAFQPALSSSPLPAFRQSHWVSRTSMSHKSAFVPASTSLGMVAASGRSQRGQVTMGLFGLGAPEIGVIIAVAGFVLGPQKLGEMARDFGKVAGELKDVPREFQEGLSEGEEQAKALKGAEPEVASKQTNGDETSDGAGKP